MDALTICVGIAMFLAGFVGGLLTHHRWVYQPLLDLNEKLQKRLYFMKRQGFVPQFAVKQRQTVDPSSQIREF